MFNNVIKKKNHNTDIISILFLDNSIVTTIRIEYSNLGFTL